MKTNREFIPYEQALALKELGFDEPCLMYYDYSWTLVESGVYECKAPLWQQAFRWFREKYGYFPSFDFQHGDSKDNRGYFFFIININNEDFFYPEEFENEIYKTQEEAELECLKKLIEICKKS